MSQYNNLVTPSSFKRKREDAAESECLAFRSDTDDPALTRRVLSSSFLTGLDISKTFIVSGEESCTPQRKRIHLQAEERAPYEFMSHEEFFSGSSFSSAHGSNKSCDNKVSSSIFSMLVSLQHFQDTRSVNGGCDAPSTTLATPNDVSMNENAFGHPKMVESSRPRYQNLLSSDDCGSLQRDEEENSNFALSEGCEPFPGRSNTSTRCFLCRRANMERIQRWSGYRTIHLTPEAQVYALSPFYVEVVRADRRRKAIFCMEFFVSRCPVDENENAVLLSKSTDNQTGPLPAFSTHYTSCSEQSLRETIRARVTPCIASFTHVSASESFLNRGIRSDGCTLSSSFSLYNTETHSVPSSLSTNSCDTQFPHSSIVMRDEASYFYEIQHYVRNVFHPHSSPADNVDTEDVDCVWRSSFAYEAVVNFVVKSCEEEVKLNSNAPTSVFLYHGKSLSSVCGKKRLMDDIISSCHLHWKNQNSFHTTGREEDEENINSHFDASLAGPAIFCICAFQKNF